MIIDGNIVYRIAEYSYNDNFLVFGVNDDTTPVKLGGVHVSNTGNGYPYITPMSMAKYKNKMFLGMGYGATISSTNSLKMIDITLSTNPYNESFLDYDWANHVPRDTNGQIIPMDMALYGNYLVVGYRSSVGYSTNTVRIFDISNEYYPKYVSGKNLTGVNVGNINALQVDGHYLYLFFETTPGCVKVDLKDIYNPTFVNQSPSSNPYPYEVRKSKVQDGYLYLIDWWNKFWIYRDEGASQVFVGSCALVAGAYAVDIMYPYAVVANPRTDPYTTYSNGSFEVIDISDRQHPVSIFQCFQGETHANASEFYDIAIRPPYIYLAGNLPYDNMSLRVMKLNILTSPSAHIGAIKTNHLAVDEKLHVDGDTNIDGTLSVGQGINTQGTLSATGKIHVGKDISNNANLVVDGVVSVSSGCAFSVIASTPASQTGKATIFCGSGEVSDRTFVVQSDGRVDRVGAPMVTSTEPVTNPSIAATTDVGIATVTVTLQHKTFVEFKYRFVTNNASGASRTYTISHLLNGAIIDTHSQTNGGSSTELISDFHYSTLDSGTYSFCVIVRSSSSVGTQTAEKITLSVIRY